MLTRVIFVFIFIITFKVAFAQEGEFDKLWKNYQSAMDSGDYNAALIPISEIVEIARKEVGKADTLYAIFLNEKAKTFYQLGAYEKALPLFEEAFAIYKKALGLEHPDIPTRLNNVAVVYSDMGRYEKALGLYEQVLAIRKKALGPEHPDVAASLDDLSLVYFKIGQYEKAIPLNEEALAIYKKTLGSEHPEVATSINNLAMVYYKMGQYEKSMSLNEEALAVRKKILGSEHLDVATSQKNLASVYVEMGQYEKALPLYEEVLAIRKKVLGPGHIDVVISLNNLALLYSKMGQYEKALPLYEEALAIRKMVLGPGHLDVAISFNNLGLLYTKMGQYEKALQYNEQALAIIKKTQGPEHPDVATSLNNLALNYYYLGQYEKSLSLNEEALVIRKKVLGPEHPDVANSLGSLALLYSNMGQYEKSLSLNEEALVIRKKVFGHEHIDVAQNLNNLALLYYYWGQYEKSLPLYEEALYIIKKILGPEHPDFATFLNNLAALYSIMGQYEKALPIYEQTLVIYKKVLGSEHHNIAMSLNNLGLNYYYLAQYEKALPLFEQALAIYKNAMGPEHPDVAFVLNNLALVYLQMVQYEKAIPLSEQALSISKKILGPEHPNVAMGLNNLAMLYYDMGQYEKALPLNEEALDIRKKTHGPDHPNEAVSLNNIGLIYCQMGQYKKALPFYEHALAIYKNALGPEHPEVTKMLGNLAVLYSNMGQYEKASALLNESNANFKKQLTTDFTILSESQKLTYIKEKGNSMIVYDSYSFKYDNASPSIKQTAMNNSIFINGIILRSSQQLRNTIANSNDTILKNNFSDWISLKRQHSIAVSLTLEERAHKVIDINKLEEEITRKERDLTLRSNAFFIEKEKENLDFIKLKAKLKAGQAYVLFNNFSYFNENDWTDSVLYTAFVIRPEINEPELVYLFEQESLDSLLGGNDANTIIPTLYGNSDLYNLIWKPFSPFLEGAKEIYLTPSGSLHKLSFSAISDSTGTLLSDKYTLHQISSASQLAFPSNPILFDTNESNSTSIALFGGINYQATEKELTPVVSSFIDEKTFTYSTRSLLPAEADRGMNWNSLPGTQKEVTEIQRLFDQNKSNSLLFTQNKALEENVKELESEKAPLILHFATHGFFIPDPKIDINKYYSRNNLLNIEPSPVEQAPFGGIGCSFKILNDSLLITDCLPDGPSFKAGILPGDIILAINDSIVSGSSLTSEIAKNKIRGPVGSNIELVVFRKSDSKIINFKVKRELIQTTSNTLTQNSKIAAKTTESNLKSFDDPLLRSGLLFAGSANIWKGEPTLPGAEDGILTATEVANLNLIKTKLVVLSACETALGDIKGKEGVFGLQRGFKLAGVDYIIMSLWRIPDQETSEFMIKFYTFLLQVNNIPIAFAKAQSEMKSKYREEPYKWAGLVLVE